MVYNDASLVGYIADASWAFNWNTDANRELPTAVEFCPMLWGPKMYTRWQPAVSKALSSEAAACWVSTSRIIRLRLT
jgi:hypothetical protein